MRGYQTVGLSLGAVLCLIGCGDDCGPLALSGCVGESEAGNVPAVAPTSGMGAPVDVGMPGPLQPGVGAPSLTPDSTAPPATPSPMTTAAPPADVPGAPTMMAQMEPVSPGPGGPDYPTVENMFDHLPSGQSQLTQLCSRPGTDKIREVFCVDNPPVITNLKQFVEAMGLGFVIPFSEGGQVAQGGNPGIAITGHSSSLVARNVNQINPRVIYYTSPIGITREADGRLPRMAFLGFVRGEQFVEFASNSDDDRDKLSFFLVRFQQACNADHSCSVGHLLSPAIERDWTGITIYEDEDIKNTAVDCQRCHQPDGPSSAKMLRLQEFKVNWTHFFRNKGPSNLALQQNPGIDFEGPLVNGPTFIPGLEGGLALLNDFHKAHGYEEDYGAVPADYIPESAPIFLEDIIKFKGDRDRQVNEYNGLIIEQEILALNPFQPGDNSVPGKSPTWEKLFDNYLYGNVIAPPYHDVKVTDPVKLAILSEKYRQFVDGEITADEIPDIRDAFLDSQAWKMGFAAKPGLDGQGIITQLCSTCHNGKLDQTISRARFDADLTQMTMEQRATAAQRLQLPDDHLLKMPPIGSSSLTDEEIDLVVETLLSTGPLIADIQPTTYSIGADVNQTFKNAGAPVVNCTSDGLPAGLTLSVQDGSCHLSGTLEEAASMTMFSVYAESADGQRDRGTIKLAGTFSLPPNLANLDAQQYVIDQAVSPIRFANSGNAAIACSASPELPPGLTVTAAGDTCEISGTPVSVVGPMTYFVTATAEGGATESGFVHLEVLAE